MEIQKKQKRWQTLFLLRRGSFSLATFFRHHRCAFSGHQRLRSNISLWDETIHDHDKSTLLSSSTIIIINMMMRPTKGSFSPPHCFSLLHCFQSQSLAALACCSTSRFFFWLLSASSEFNLISSHCNCHHDDPDHPDRHHHHDYHDHHLRIEGCRFLVERVLDVVLVHHLVIFSHQHFYIHHLNLLYPSHKYCQDHHLHIPHHDGDEAGEDFRKTSSWPPACWTIVGWVSSRPTTGSGKTYKES